MRKKLKIGIVGCGAIGSSLAKAVVEEYFQDARLAAIYDIDPEKSRSLSRALRKNGSLVAAGLTQAIEKADLVIEASSAAAAWKIARSTLKNRRDIMIMSVGGILSRLDRLRGLARRSNARVYIPSGAISGIDALKAAATGRIDKVVLTTTKNPRAFKGVEYVEKKWPGLGSLKEPVILFSGSAERAVGLFPRNINVAAVLSLAGTGARHTKVVIIACASERKNMHEIAIECDAGSIFTRTQNVIHPDNPKTSYLAVLSAKATLRQIFDPVRVGT